MAILDSSFSFTGSFGNLVAYRLPGNDRIIIRRKSGASKQRIKTSPEYENTRKVNTEFSGRATASKWIMRMMYPLKSLADYNIAGPLNSLLKPIQGLDTESKFGERHVILSKNPKLLEGFSLNRKNVLDSYLRCPLRCTVSRERLEAVVSVPELIAKINFFPPERSPLYSMVAVMGVIPDLYFTDGRYIASEERYSALVPVIAESEWFPCAQGSKGIELKINYPAIPTDENFTLMLTVGIRFGTLSDMSTMKQIKNVGAARTVMVG